MQPHFAGFLSSVLATCLPCACALCGQNCAEAVCPICCLRYFNDATARCDRCALPLAGLQVRSAHNTPTLCGACLAKAPPFDSTRAACDYGAPADSLVLGLKFGHQLALAPWFAARLATLARDGRAPLPDLLCPVPLGPQRLATRGFNQALEIARPLARALALPLQARLALRVRDTPAQAQLKPGERARNLRAAFTLAPQAGALVRGRHIGLVDDVMTTGHTLAALAAMFKRFGAARVSNFVFARTPARPF